MGSKLEEEFRKDRVLPAKITEVVKNPEISPTESSVRSLRRVAPIGDFKKKTPESHDVNAVIDDAKQMVSSGVNPNSTVSIILPDERGQNVVERQLPLAKVAELSSGNEVYEKLAGKGGWIAFDDGGGGGAGVYRAMATNWNLKFAGIIAKRGIHETEPTERRKHAIAVSRFIAAAEDVNSGAVPNSMLVAAVGGDVTPHGLGKPNLPPRWYMIGEASKIGYLWMMDQLKYRFQYTLLGKFFTIPWSTKNYYSEQRKAMKKFKKVSDLEKRLDLFDINIEDVFDLGKLSIEEVWELDKIEKVKPTMDEYHAMVKLMDSEGYYDYAEAAKAFEKGVVR